MSGGRARRIAHGLYSYDLSTPPEELVRAHWLEVAGHYCPGAVIADRSVLLAQPDERGLLFVVHARARPVSLPGLTIVPRAGAGPLTDDMSLPHGLWISSRPRALVENLAPSRAVKGRPPRTLTRNELRAWVLRLFRLEGAVRLNEMRDRARQIAIELGREKDFEELDELIGAALGTREVRTDFPPLLAAQRGVPFDEERLAAFDILVEWFDERAPSPRQTLAEDAPRRRFLPFFEAYFSNFIEGTEFEIDEARRLVFDGAVPLARPADAHHVTGTFQIVADDAEMRRVPRTADELLLILRQRHVRLMSARPEKSPGEFKSRPNRAGSTQFVAPHLVEGTLRSGFARLQRLRDPFARAAFTMFLITEVHPFEDGNGRLARIMMNSELHAANEIRIIIPTVFRNEYLAALRAMTHNRDPRPLDRVLDFAQRYTAQIDFTDYATAKGQLERSHAFVRPEEALERGLRLRLPGSLLP